jgi:NAD(P)-dependent dehydrogenase (short-subunit alcohol dehydrogenase family)
MQFGVNFLSHALIIQRLLHLLEETAAQYGDARIVNLTSNGYAFHKGGLPFGDLKTTQQNLGIGAKWKRYGQSKFAIAIYTAELARRYPTVTSVAIHPGVINTGIMENQPFWDRMYIKFLTIGQSISLEEGVYNTLWAATTPMKEKLKSGAVYYPVGQLQEHTKAAKDENLWKELWEWTEAQINT